MSTTSKYFLNSQAHVLLNSRSQTEPSKKYYSFDLGRASIRARGQLEILEDGKTNSSNRSVIMRSSRLNASLLLLILAVFSTTITARTADDDADEYDVKARVVRVSLVTGEVSLKRNGNTEWEPVRLNFPLVEGDTVSTDQDSRLELQIDARNFVRLGGRTVLRIVTLRDEGVALSVVEGTATVRLAKFDREDGYFEIDGPKTTFAAEKKWLYRIDVPREGRVGFTVRDGGSARIYSDTSGFALREGRSAERPSEEGNASAWECQVPAA